MGNTPQLKFQLMVNIYAPLKIVYHIHFRFHPGHTYIYTEAILTLTLTHTGPIVDFANIYQSLTCAHWKHIVRSFARLLTNSLTTASQHFIEVFYMLIAFSTPQSQCLNIAAVAQCACVHARSRSHINTHSHIIMFKLSIQFVSHSRALHVSCRFEQRQEQQIYLYAYTRAHT